MTETEQLLAERGKTHGDYTDHARCTQAIMRALMAEKNWDDLPDVMKESLHMFAHKMGRVVTGDPFHADHWDDIAGYAKLVSQRIGGLLADAAATYIKETMENIFREDTETATMNQYVEKNILGGKAARTEHPAPYGYTATDE